MSKLNFINIKITIFIILFLSFMSISSVEAASKKDRTAPTISYIKSSTVTLEYGKTFNYKNYIKVKDNTDKNPKVTISGKVNNKKIGKYTIKIRAKDKYGNTSKTKYLYVRVVDTTAPNLKLSQTSSTICYKSSFNPKDYIVSAVDNKDGNLKSSVIISNTVNTNKIGTYSVSYSVKDKSNNKAQKTLKVTVKKDTTAPVLTLTEEEVSINVFSTFSPESYIKSAIDDMEGDVLSNVTYDSQVNTNQLGEYIVKYSVSDKSGNQTFKELKVKVVDNIKPVITLKKTSLELYVNDSFKPLSYVSSVTDNYDGNLLSSVKYTSKVDMTKGGTYTVTYSVTDSSGNKATKTLKVVVKDTGYKLAEIAKTKLGCQYVYGAAGPNTFDCSGFTQWVHKQAGITIPRVSSDQGAQGKEIPLSQVQVGDIVWRSGHVGLYVGDGLVIHSPHTGAVVSYTTLEKGKFVKAVRYY
jgi:cell wall-associated NlpC family hydrolase